VVFDTVLFDFANTLAYINPKREEIIYNFLLDKLKMKISKLKISKALKQVDEEIHYSSVKIRSIERKREFYRKYNKRLLQLLEIDFTSKNCLGLYDYYANTIKEWNLFPEVIGLMEELKKKDMRIGIASNFDSVLKTTLIHQLGLTEYLDFTVVSQIIGLEKPDMRFYEFVISQNSLIPNNTLYIGDSYSLDYLPGKRANLNCFLYDIDGVYKDKSDTINNLTEILQFI
jgi:putative hydrolase of the HAD superfamily